MDIQNNHYNNQSFNNMREYAFLFIRKENAPVGQKNCMTFNNWKDMEQAKQSARAYLGMMRADYQKVCIYVLKGTMWVDSGEFIEVSEI